MNIEMGLDLRSNKNTWMNDNEMKLTCVSGDYFPMF